jgi:SpoVT / AbrB like domain.
MTREVDMSHTKLSATYRVKLPKEVRESAHLERGQEFQIIVKSGIVHLVPLKSLDELRGFAPGLTTEGLRDKSDRM